MKVTAKNQGNIKRMLQVLAMSMLIVVFTGCKGTTDSGPKDDIVFKDKTKITGEEQLKSLVGTKWKLVGFVETKTGNLKEAEPLDKGDVGAYAIHFANDTTIFSRTSTNSINVTCKFNYLNNEIIVKQVLRTEVGEMFGDGEEFINSLMSLSRFEVNTKQLKMYYNNGDNYLLYNYLHLTY